MAAVTAGVIAVGAGAMAANQARKGAKAAKNAAAQGLAQYDGIDLPSVEEQKLMLEKYGLQGEYTPEMLQALGLDPSAMEGVQADEQSVNAQREALTTYQDMAQGGLTEADKAAARDIQRGVANDDIARRKALLDQFAQRGVLGSGMELAAQLQGQQQSMDTQSQNADKLIQQAQARQLEALGSSANLASSMRSQDFGEKSAVAQARDAINQFNTQNQQSVNNMNVGNRNTAQQQNLANKQAISNSNVDLSNQEQIHNKGLQQQNFNNQMNMAGARAGQYNAIGNAAQQGANATASAIAGIGSGLTNIAGSFMNNAGKTTTLDSRLDETMAKNKGIF